MSVFLRFKSNQTVSNKPCEKREIELTRVRGCSRRTVPSGRRWGGRRHGVVQEEQWGRLEIKVIEMT